jgi:hypothetical protein
MARDGRSPDDELKVEPQEINMLWFQCCILAGMRSEIAATQYIFLEQRFQAIPLQHSVQSAVSMLVHLGLVSPLLI